MFRQLPRVKNPTMAPERASGVFQVFAATIEEDESTGVQMVQYAAIPLHATKSYTQVLLLLYLQYILKGLVCAFRCCVTSMSVHYQSTIHHNVCRVST